MRGLRLPSRTSYDLMLTSVVLGLLAIGLAMVYSASGIKALDALDDPRYYLIQQSAWVAIGLLALFVVARIDYHRYRALALPGLIVAIVLLSAVLVPGIGTRVGGASRWLRVSSFAGLQPAEAASKTFPHRAHRIRSDFNRTSSLEHSPPRRCRMPSAG